MKNEFTRLKLINLVFRGIYIHCLKKNPNRIIETYGKVELGDKKWTTLVRCSAIGCDALNHHLRCQWTYPKGKQLPSPTERVMAITCQRSWPKISNLRLSNKMILKTIDLTIALGGNFTKNCIWDLINTCT